MLDTNREHLVWPGVPAGSTAVKPFFMKNGSDTETMHLTLVIQDSPNFKVGSQRKCGGDLVRAGRQKPKTSMLAA